MDPSPIAEERGYLQLRGPNADDRGHAQLRDLNPSTEKRRHPWQRGPSLITQFGNPTTEGSLITEFGDPHGWEVSHPSLRAPMAEGSFTHHCELRTLRGPSPITEDRGPGCLSGACSRRDHRGVLRHVPAGPGWAARCPPRCRSLTEHSPGRAAPGGRRRL